MGLGRGGLVPVRVLAVGADAVAKLHAQRAVSERRRVGAAESARPLGVGVDVFGELEVFVREASSQHEIHPDAVTQGLMRCGRVKLPEGIVALLQLCFQVVYTNLANSCAAAYRGGAKPAFVKRTKSSRPPPSPGLSPSFAPGERREGVFCVFVLSIIKRDKETEN